MNRPKHPGPIGERCLSAPYRGDLRFRGGDPPTRHAPDLFFSRTSFPQTQDPSLLDARDRHLHAPFYRLELAEEPHFHFNPTTTAPPAPEQPRDRYEVPPQRQVSGTSGPERSLGKDAAHRGKEDQ